jgi:hypothetical protein
MTRQELIKKGSSEVRHNATAFSLFKEFIIIDFGKLPDGCFGCQFNNTFQSWKEYVDKYY